MHVSLGAGAPTSALPIPDGWARASFNLCIIMPIVAAFVVGGRFYTRRLTHIRPGIDDWFVLVALLLYWVQAIIAALAVPYGGIGHHKDDLAPNRIVYLLKLLLSVQYFYCTPLAFAKASVCFFLLRIFGRIRWFKLAAYAVIVACAGFMLLNIFTASFICRPIAANWNKSIPGAHCGDEEATFIAVAVFDVAIDIAIITLPLPIIWSLQMSTRDRLSVTALLTFGTFDAVAGIMRIVTSIKVDFKADWTVTLGELWFWSVLEPGLAVCVVCLIVMRPLLDKVTFRRRSTDLSMKLRSIGSGRYYGGDSLDRSRAGSTAAEAINEPVNVPLESLSHEDDFRLSSTRLEERSSTRTGRDIVVSREVHITTEDRKQYLPEYV